MASNKTKKGSWFSELSLSTKVFLKTQILSFVLYTSAFLISGALGLSINVSKGNAFYLAVFFYSVCSFICAFYAVRYIHKNGLSVGFLFCLPMNIIIVFASIAANSFQIDLTAVISFFILAISSMLGGIVSVNTRIKVKKGRIK